MRKFLKNNRILAALLLTVILVSACTDYLEIAPEKDLVKKNFWKTKDDANSALAATYSTFRSASLQSWIWGEVRADIVTLLPGNYQAIAGSDISTINSVVDWSAYYSAINLANTLMYFDGEVMKSDKSFTQKMKDGLDAEALFIRSLTYFYLVRVWKEVPLVLNPSISDTCDIYPRKSTENEIINQIISDLLIAKDKAYTTEFVNNNKIFRGRANKYSIMTLLADVYLWNEQYQKCIDYCDSVTNSGIYSLVSKDNWFSIYYPGNSIESIFELQFNDDGTDDQINPFFKSVNYGNNMTTGAPQYRTLIEIAAGRANYNLNYKYGSLFPDETDNRTCKNKSAIWKYVGRDAGLLPGQNSEPRLPTERNTGIIYYRYADILLMKAEALNELNQVEAAQALVTQTAERAGLQPITGITDKIQMRNTILEERAKEFVLEGKRWFDVLRAGKRNKFQNKRDVATMLISNAEEKSKAVLTSKVNDTMMYYLPISYDELKRNKNLTQNPFYER